MPIDAKTFTKELLEKLNAFEKQAITDMCLGFTLSIYKTTDIYPVPEAEKILHHLRNKRLFGLMQKVADALIQTGRESFRIRRQYAQSLIDTENYTAALAILNALSADTKNAGGDKTAVKEYQESQGLIGRVYKQLYIKADAPSNPLSIDYLKKSIEAYHHVYCDDDKLCLWHGVNVVTLLCRAKADGITLKDFPDPQKLAEKILTVVEEKYADVEQRADAWDFAIASELCVALNKPEDAVEWLCGYLSDQYIGAFEVASSLRQMEEVWKLDMNSEMGKLILPLLRAELLKREGGNVMIDTKQLKQQKDTEQKTTTVYERLLMKPVATNEVKLSNAGLEKVFGNDSYNSYKWMMTANERGLAVARIGREAAKGFGTGFLLHGRALHENLGDEFVLLTNAHVVSEDPKEKSLRCYEAIIIFEALDRDEEFNVSEIIWSSPSTELDTSILRFDAANTTRLKELMKNVKLYPVAPSLPGIEEKNLSERIYIIGHPAGGTLQFSLQDNLLLDYEDPHIHYRTPTIGGSSGSPVFNARWDLIGLHHAGRRDMPKLNGKEGYYEANEGIWIQSVKNQLKKVL